MLFVLCLVVILPFALIAIAIIVHCLRDNTPTVDIEHAVLSEEQKRLLHRNSDVHFYPYYARDAFDRDFYDDDFDDEDFDDEDDEIAEKDSSPSLFSKFISSGRPEKEDFWKETYAYWDKVDTEDLHDALMGDDIAAEFMDDMYGEDGW